MRIRVGILGATGTVGQRFIQLLDGHPWFEVTVLAASSRSAGQKYAQATHWVLPTPIPAWAREMTIVEGAPETMRGCDMLLSALPGELAGPLEEALAAAGYVVCSNASAHRMDPDVPLVVPEVNADHLTLIEVQRKNRGWPGFIVTAANCTTTHLVLALKPLQDAFGIRFAHVVTMQAISGAGYPGVPSYDILGNVIPYIGGEEEKVERETAKMLGQLQGDRIQEATLVISAQCNRVPVYDGHTECVSLKLERPATLEQVKEALRNFRGLPQELKLPSAPEHPVLVREESDRPQPTLDRDAEKGMATVVGRIRPCPLFDYKFVLLGHNTVRGAAGGALLNAELLVAKGLIPR